jgi:hypothetical protein
LLTIDKLIRCHLAGDMPRRRADERSKKMLHSYVVLLQRKDITSVSLPCNEIAEEFITGLAVCLLNTTSMFHKRRWKVIEKLASKVEELELKLDEAITENAELKEFVVESSD